MKSKSIGSQIMLIFLLASILSVLLLIRTGPVQASDETVVEILPSTSSASLGQTFTVNVTVSDVQNLYGVEATVSWNSSILQLANLDVRLGQDDGVLNNNTFLAQNSTQEDQLSVAGTSVNPAPPFNGSGNIVRITFNVINSGYSSIDLESQLYDHPPPDGISSPIQHTTIGGSFVKVTPEIPNSAIFLVFTILTASALVLSKKMTRRSGHASRP